MVRMETFIETNEASLRLGIFLGVLLLMGLWETFSPARSLKVNRALRWGNNLALVVLNSLLLRWVFPAAAVGMAVFTEGQNWGLLNVWELPFVVEVILAVVVLDFVIWLQHVMVHSIPALWRLHRVHHADPDYDTTTGLRFHPVEILLSMVIKFAAISVLGPAVLAVILFEIILNASAMFNHGNVRLPTAFDRVLRWFIVTPDMHRVHHSVESDETNSNFGFSLSIWDRLFGTYRDQPRAGHLDMQIGIHGFHKPAEVTWLPGLLLLPFKGKVGDYTINRRWDAQDQKKNDQVND